MRRVLLLAILLTVTACEHHAKCPDAEWQESPYILGEKEFELVCKSTGAILGTVESDSQVRWLAFDRHRGYLSTASYTTKEAAMKAVEAED